MSQLSRKPPTPRTAKPQPSYPRCVGLALAVAFVGGCDRSSVTMAGDVAPVFDAGASPAPAGTTAPTHAASNDVPLRPAGIAVAPFDAGGAPSPRWSLVFSRDPPTRSQKTPCRSAGSLP